MTIHQRPASRGLAVVLMLAVATAVAAQGFVWPPAEGDRRVKSGGAKTGRIQAIEQPLAADPLPTNPLETDPLPTDRLPSEEPLSFAARSTTAAASPPLPAVAAPPAGGQTQWKILENPNGPHAALIFDPVRQVFAVYHIDAGSGQIMLKSVRNLSADLRLEQFNSGAPAPKDIQAMLDEARGPR